MSKNLGNLEKCAVFFSKCPFGNSLMSANFELGDFFENICDVIF